MEKLTTCVLCTVGGVARVFLGCPLRSAPWYFLRSKLGIVVGSRTLGLRWWGEHIFLGKAGNQWLFLEGADVACFFFFLQVSESEMSIDTTKMETPSQIPLESEMSLGWCILGYLGWLGYRTNQGGLSIVYRLDLRLYYDTPLAPRELYNPFVLRKLNLGLQVFLQVSCETIRSVRNWCRNGRGNLGVALEEYALGVAKTLVHSVQVMYSFL